MREGGGLGISQKRLPKDSTKVQPQVVFFGNGPRMAPYCNELIDEFEIID